MKKRFLRTQSMHIEEPPCLEQRLHPIDTSILADQVDIKRDIFNQKHASLPINHSISTSKHSKKKQFAKRPLSRSDLNRINFTGGTRTKRPLTSTSKPSVMINHAEHTMFNNRNNRVTTSTPDGQVRGKFAV